MTTPAGTINFLGPTRDAPGSTRCSSCSLYISTFRTLRSYVDRGPSKKTAPPTEYKLCSACATPLEQLRSILNVELT